MQKRKKNRMAGEKITEMGEDYMAQATKDVPAKQVKTAAKADATAGAPAQRDWSQPNWDNPTKKEQRKFKKATGYPQYLGGFREDYRKDYMEDGQIDYFADNKHYDKIYKQIGKHTGLNFNKVDRHDDAEIMNFWSKETSGEFGMSRKDRKGGTGKRYGYNNPSFEEAGKEFEQIRNDTTGKLYLGGLSTAIDPKEYAKENPYMNDIQDMHQSNRVNALRGDRKSQRAAAWHEVGHSLGLRGDTSLNDKDPSVMSYNHGIKGNRLGEREYESIKRLHSEWL